jgi:transmembrane sensor
MDLVVNKELLQKYFVGNVTVFEKKLIDEWAKVPENQEIFYAILAKKENQNPQFSPDVDLALEKLKLRIDNQFEIVIEEPSKQIFPFNYLRWAVAAMIVFLLGTGLWINRNSLIYQTYQTAFGEVKTIQLTDGSTVVLNANSTLKLQRFGFGEHSREVFLEGEAQFSVKHKADNQPFIVKTSKQFDILVLGTVFNVYSRTRGAKVVLNSGKIQLNYHDGKTKKQVIMKPGDLVTFDKSNKIKKIIPVETKQYSAWKEHRFVFNETSLEEIIQLFDENFGQKIIIQDPELLSWTVSGSFTALNAEELVETLSEASNLSYKKEGDAMVIFNSK